MRDQISITKGTNKRHSDRRYGETDRRTDPQNAMAKTFHVELRQEGNYSTRRILSDRRES